MTRHYPDMCSDASSVWNFCAPFLDVIWRGNEWLRRQMSAVLLGYRLSSSSHAADVPPKIIHRFDITTNVNWSSPTSPGFPLDRANILSGMRQSQGTFKRDFCVLFGFFIRWIGLLHDSHSVNCRPWLVRDV